MGRPTRYTEPSEKRANFRTSVALEYRSRKSHFAAKKILFAFLLAATFVPVSAQRPAVALAETESWFDGHIGIENSGLINGSNYKVKFLGVGTNPFFQEGELTGTVSTAGQLYNASLLYDISRDVLVVKHMSTSGLAWFIELEKKTVDEFSLGDKVFRPYNGGFHELVFESDSFFILGRYKKEERAEKGVNKYFPVNEYFIVSKGRWMRVGSIAAFNNLIADKGQRRELKAFMRAQRIRPAKFDTDDLIRVGQFVSKLLTSAS